MKLYVVITFIAAILIIVLVIFGIISQIVETKKIENSLEEELDHLYAENESLKKDVAWYRVILKNIKKHPELAEDFFADAGENDLIFGEYAEENKKLDSDKETPFCFGVNDENNSSI